jgi:branched-chain amino acid aminotransferase
MGEYVIFNGKMIPGKDLAITGQNRSFRYGDGIFETIRCRQGIPMWIEHHLQRLRQSANVLRIPLSDRFTDAKLISMIKALLQANEHKNGARLRFSLFRAEGGFYKPTQYEGCFMIETSALENESYILNNKGLYVGFYKEIPKPVNLLSGLKTSSAILYVMASMYGQEKGLDDIIICNDAGFVAEAGSSNIFMVENGKLITPSLDQGCVEGVMRKVLLDMADKHGYKVLECAILPEDMLKADEVFTCNAINGIQWIKGIGINRYYHDFSSAFIHLLEKEAEEYIEKKFL